MRISTEDNLILPDPELELEPALEPVPVRPELLLQEVVTWPAILPRKDGL